jgi:hypothetical protein
MLYFSAAAFDHQDLQQVGVAVHADPPIVERATRCNRLSVNEIKRSRVRRIAVEMKEWQVHRAGSLRTGEWPMILSPRDRR